MEKGKEMDIRDAELIVDEEVEIKSEPVDDENDVQFVTDVVKEQTRPAAKKIRQEKNIKIIQIGTESNKLKYFLLKIYFNIKINKFFER